MTTADLAMRLAALSPDKRAILERALAERSAASHAADGPRPRPGRGEGTAPLTDAQRLLWLAEQMRPSDAAYNVPIARRVRGVIDVAAFERALTAVVAAHEGLRTTFAEEDGEPVQRVGVSWDVRVTVADLVTSEHAQQESVAVMHRIASTPFDLAKGPLLRAAVVRMAEETIVLIVVHHLVCDGGSIDLLLRDLAAAYTTALRGEEPRITEPPLQPADLAIWEQTPARRAAVARSAAFWRGYLAGASAELDLAPVQSARGAVSTARTSIEIPGTLLTTIRRHAAGSGTTPFVVLLSAFEAVLHRYTGQDDLLVGIPVAGRGHPDAEATIGHFTDTVIVRARVAARTTFDALLAATREDVIHVLENQIGAATALLQLDADGATRVGAPQLFFGLQPARGARAALGSHALEPVAALGGGAKFLLSINAVESEDRIRITAEFASDRLSESFVARMLSHYVTFLESVTADPASVIGAVNILSSAEEATIRSDWSRGPIDPITPDAIHALVRSAAQRTPVAPAVHGSTGTLTYAELDAASDAVARRLIARGVKRGAIVGVSLDKGREFPVAVLGVLKAGATFLPLDPSYPRDRIEYMLRDARAELVLASPGVSALDGAAWERVDESWYVDTATTASITLPTVMADDPAYVIYTSGSTGRPKGVVIRHASAANLAHASRRAIPIDSSDRVLQFAALSFDASIFEMLWTFAHGASLQLLPSETATDPVALESFMSSHGVTATVLPPTVLRALDPRRIPTLRTVKSAGEPLGLDIVRRWSGRRLYNGYGPTEATVCATVWEYDGDDTRVPAIGRPLANCATYVLDPCGALAPIGVPGELHIGGAGVGAGYLGRPELTSEKFIPDPFGSGERMYRTGDRARWREDGALEFLGRIDDQVKLRGFRIELGEVEARLAEHAAVEQSAVVLRDIPRGEAGTEPALVGFYVPRARSHTDALGSAEGRALEGMLRDHLRSVLPAYMVPAILMRLRALPLTPTGKVDRRALSVRAIDGFALSGGVTPRTAVEATVADVWGIVLGRAVTDVEASFLDLGGHSLLATRVVGQVARVFGTSITLRSFFEQPTVAGHAAALLAVEAAPGRCERIADVFLQARRTAAPASVPSFAPLAQSPMPAGSRT